MVEAFDDVGAEEEAGAPRAEAPAVDFVRVRPEEVAHGAFVGDFLFAVQEADFVDGFDEGGQAAVDAEDGAAAVGERAVAVARCGGAGRAGFGRVVWGGRGGGGHALVFEGAAPVAGEAGCDFVS